MHALSAPPLPVEAAACAWFAQALQDSEARFRAFMDFCPVGAWMKDEDGRYVYVNRQVERLHGVRLDDLRGKTDFDWFPPEFAALFRAHDQVVLDTQEPFQAVEDVPTPDGRVRQFLVIKFPFRDAAGRRFIGGMGVDVTEQKALEGRLRELALTDGLTGLKNSRHFHEALGAAHSFALRQGQPLSVAMIDVDEFKQFNDTFGHQGGDSALCAVAATLRAAVRGHDLVARYGGEEFAVLMPSTDAAGARAAAERVREAVERHAWPLRPVTVSVGVATLTDATRDAAELVALADRALYHSKRHGKNRVTHHADMPPLPARRPS